MFGWRIVNKFELHDWYSSHPSKENQVGLACRTNQGEENYMRDLVANPEENRVHGRH